MSKQVKQMQMDALRKTFQGVSNFVVLNASKVPATTENHMRLTLRKKGVRLQMVKNSLAKRVFSEMGVTLKDEVWSGPSIFAWGGESIKGLSQELETVLKDQTKKDPKFREKLTVKTAVTEGQQVTFDAALKMPTRLEVIGQIVGAILGPASQIAGCLIGPGGQVASQIESKTKEEAAPAA